MQTLGGSLIKAEIGAISDQLGWLLVCKDVSELPSTTVGFQNDMANHKDLVTTGFDNYQINVGNHCFGGGGGKVG